eukprot:TRINITY_DN6551_c0_g1_i1.p1 TRINITY_DN6551_c0_g1~~TRINITY_DN6551_c0_g1_i1.p1  ORF type:complete len:932 (-),score=196.62 TRINITY_DN6551_c0_g1_i1:118-2913(-)
MEVTARQRLEVGGKPQPQPRNVVFISQAGPDAIQYRFAAYVKTKLQLADVPTQLSPLDENTLKLEGGSNDQVSLQQAKEALGKTRAGVVALSPAFVTSKASMMELHALLACCEKDSSKLELKLIPVLLGLSLWQCKNIRQLYDIHRWPDGQRPDAQQLELWAADIDELCRSTEIQPAQADGCESQVATSVADTILAHLERTKLDQVPFETKGPGVSDELVSPFFLQRTTNNLVGREAVVEEVKTKLMKQRSVVLYGEAGEGKTAVAMEAAAQLCEQGHFPGGSFMVDMTDLALDTPTLTDKDVVFLSIYYHIVTQLTRQLLMIQGGIKESSPEGDAHLTPVQQWLELQSNKQQHVLVAFENMECVSKYGKLATRRLEYAMRHLLRNFAAVKLIGTSRKILGTGSFCSIQSLNVKASAQLLKRGAQGALLTELQAMELGERSCHNAHLLATVSSILEAGMCTLTDLLSQPRPLSRKAKAGDHASGAPRQLLVDTMQQWLAAALPDETRKVLAQLSVFPQGPGAVCTVAATQVTGLGAAAVSGHLGVLCSLCMMHPPPGPAPFGGHGGERFTMHGITHATAVKMFSELPQLEQAQAQEGFAWYVLGLAPRMKILELHPDRTAAVLGLLRAEVGNVRGLVQLFDSRDTLTKLRTAEWAACVTDLSERLYAREMLFDTESLRRLALTIFEEVLGPKHYETATALDNLGTVLVGRGEPWATDGLPLFRRAATIREEELGALHELTVLSRFQLAHTLRDLGKAAEAEPVYRRALAIAEQMAGPKSVDVAATLDNLATALKVLGRFAEAEPLYRRALGIHQEVLGLRNLDTATSINNVGCVVECLGDVAEAERLHRCALEIREAVAGPKHLDTAMSLFNVGYILNAQGKEAPAAAALLERALQVYTEVLDKKHPQTIKTRQELRKAQRRAANTRCVIC